MNYPIQDQRWISGGYLHHKSIDTAYFNAHRILFFSIVLVNFSDKVLKDLE
jgi:hypothetical protein